MGGRQDKPLLVFDLESVGSVHIWVRASELLTSAGLRAQAGREKQRGPGSGVGLTTGEKGQAGGEGVGKTESRELTRLGT